MSEDATYVIIDASDVSSIVWPEIQQTDADTLRFNVDPANTKAVVSFLGSATPSFLDGKTQYTWAEIMTIMGEAEWTAPID